MKNETVACVLARWLQRRPLAEAGLTPPASVPLRTAAEQGTPNVRPFLTADEFRSIREYVDLFNENCGLLLELTRMLSHPNLSDLQAKRIVQLVQRSLLILEEIAPILIGLDRFSGERRKAVSLCRECVDRAERVVAQHKLDFILNLTMLNHLEACARTTQEHSAKESINSLAEFFQVRKN